MTGPERSRSPRGWVVLVVLLTIACAAHVADSPGRKSFDLSYLVVTVGAPIVGLWYARRLDPWTRVPWMWIAVGVSCSGFADAIFTAITWLQGEQPDVSIADLFYLMSYVAITIGLMAMLGLHSREAGGKTQYDVDGLIDIASFAILAVIVVVEVTGVAEIFADDESSMMAHLIWAAYPILDAALLAVLIRAIVGRRVHGVSGGLLAIGITCWLGADLATLLIADPATISIWMDLGWMLGAAAMVGGVRFGTRTVTDGWERSRHRMGARVLISLAPLLLPGIIDTWSFLHGDKTNPVPFLIATAALVLLAYLRSTRLVRARDAQEAALIQNKLYYQALAQNSADAVIVIDGEGRIKSDASQLEAMFGTVGNVIGASVIELLDPTKRTSGSAALERVCSTHGQVHEFVYPMTHPDGGRRWFSVRAVNLLEDPMVAGIVVNVHDVTDRQRAEEELTHRAFHDSLTGLANRALFLDRVEHAVHRSARSGADVAVLYLDIDGFKTVNDSRGHEAGDHVLREIAQRLLATVRTGDTVARLGGDEFAILIEQDGLFGNDASAAAGRILEALKPPMQLDENCVVLSASIGITYGDADATASSMLRDADIAMYQSKSNGKSRWTVYDSGMRLAVLERLELETDLVSALQQRQFHLVYQPIIELITEEVVGFEALLRWHHPTKGVVQPDAFIPIAEDNGTIVPIGRWVLEEACRTAAEFQRCHPGRSLTMAVNLSTRQIATIDIVEHVALALEQSGFPAASLVLEMTESALVEDATLAAERLHQLRALGVRLAIDDFGTGYSSLSYLRQFPIDILKIDRSFVNSITDGEHIPAIIRGLLDLGKTLQLETVAEGIELGVQRDSLREQNCEFGQGFLFARPLSGAECEILLCRLDNGESARTVDGDILAIR